MVLSIIIQRLDIIPSKRGHLYTISCPTFHYIYTVVVVVSYRDAAEVKEVRKTRDPISLIAAYALDGNLVTDDELKVSP